MLLRPDGSAVLLLTGTLAGTPYVDAHMFAQHIDASGGFRWERPGLRVNPDERLLGRLIGAWESAGILHVYWSNPDGVWLQGIDEAGAPLFDQPRTAPSQHLPPDASDGLGALYEARTLEGRVRIDRVDAQGSPQWPAPRILPECDAQLGWTNDDFEHATLVGDLEGGVWIVWSERVGRDGEELEILKVTLLRPDGSLAW